MLCAISARLRDICAYAAPHLRHDCADLKKSSLPSAKVTTLVDLVRGPRHQGTAHNLTEGDDRANETCAWSCGGAGPPAQRFDLRFSPGCLCRRTVAYAHAVLASIDQALHLPAGFGSYVELRQWVEQTHGVSIKYKTLYSLVRKRFHAKLKVPRPSHTKKARGRRRFSNQLYRAAPGGDSA